MSKHVGWLVKIYFARGRRLRMQLKRSKKRKSQTKRCGKEDHGGQRTWTCRACLSAIADEEYLSDRVPAYLGHDAPRTLYATVDRLYVFLRKH